jgi:hypothetical protein
MIRAPFVWVSLLVLSCSAGSKSDGQLSRNYEKANWLELQAHARGLQHRQQRLLAGLRGRHRLGRRAVR